MTPQPDTAHQLADALLGHILTRLEAVDAIPGRAFVCGEDAIPADDCCKGLLWTRVANISVADGAGRPDLTVRQPGVPILAHAILLEAGALRCAPTVDSRGKPPKPEQYTRSALTSAQDREAVRLALECDLPADLAALQAAGQVVGAWTPIASGDCAGGFITTTIVTDW